MAISRFALSTFLTLSLSLAASAGPQEPKRLARPGRGSAVPVSPAPIFDATESAGLFVGVQLFPDEPRLPPVPYAVDDAVDLAFRMAVELEPPLLVPARVRLALAGDPVKPESQARLAALLAAGALRTDAQLVDVEDGLVAQGKAAGAAGMLVVGFATHGFLHRGGHFLMAASSVERAIGRTAISVQRMNTLLAKSRARRRLVLLDACREGPGPLPRRGGPRPSLIPRLPLAEGQAMLSARPNTSFYDDLVRRQGVFTAGVLDALACLEPFEDDEVTVAALSGYVNQHLVRWEARHLTTAGQNGLETAIGGTFAHFPLARCQRRPQERKPS